MKTIELLNSLTKADGYFHYSLVLPPFHIVKQLSSFSHSFTELAIQTTQRAVNYLYPLSAYAQPHDK